MAFRKAKSWLLKPPPGTPVSWDHPLARYLLNRWVASEGAGTKLTDSAGRANATTSGTWVQGPYGPMVAYNGSSQAASATAVKYKSANTLTVAFTYYRATNPSTYAMIMESSTDLGLNFNGTWNIWDGYNGATNKTGNYITVSIAATISGNQVTAAVIPQPTAGRVHRIVTTIDRRLTTDQITGIYVDGVAQSITYGTPIASKVTVASTFTDNAMYFAARGGTSFYNNCRLDDVLFETRLWTPAEVRSDYTDRYGMFVPPRMRMRSSATGTTADLAWTEADDVTAIAVTSSSTAAIAWTEADDTTAISVTSSGSATIAWTEQDDGCAIEVNAQSLLDTHDGGPRKRKKRDHDEFAEFAGKQAKRRQAIADIVAPQPVEVVPLVFESVPPLLTPQPKQIPRDDSFERFMRELQDDEELLMML